MVRRTIFAKGTAAIASAIIAVTAVPAIGTVPALAASKKVPAYLLTKVVMTQNGSKKVNTFSYNKKGLMVYQKGSDSNVKYSYNKLGLRTKTYYSKSGKKKYTITYYYAKKGVISNYLTQNASGKYLNKTVNTFKNGVLTKSVYTVYPSSKHAGSQTTYKYSYGKNGKTLTTKCYKLKNGKNKLVRTTYSVYGKKQALTSRTVKNASGKVIRKQTYKNSFNKHGKLSKQVVITKTASKTSKMTMTYSYKKMMLTKAQKKTAMSYQSFSF